MYFGIIKTHSEHWNIKNKESKFECWHRTNGRQRGDKTKSFPFTYINDLVCVLICVEPTVPNSCSVDHPAGQPYHATIDHLNLSQYIPPMNRTLINIRLDGRPYDQSSISTTTANINGPMRGFFEWSVPCLSLSLFSP